MLRNDSSVDSTKEIQQDRQLKQNRLNAINNLILNNSGKFAFFNFEQTLNYRNRHKTLISGTKIIRSGEFTDLSQVVLKGTEIGIDTETYGLDCRLNKIHGIGLADRHNNYYYIVVLNNEIKIVELINKLNEDNVIWILHNVKFDRQMLKMQLNIDLINTEDTLILSYLQDTEQSHKLSSLATMYLNRYPYDFGSLIQANLREDLLKGKEYKINKSDLSIIKIVDTVECAACLGIGKVSGKRINTTKKCPICKGTGKVNGTEQCLFTIDYLSLQALADYCAEDCLESLMLFDMYEKQGYTDMYLYKIDNALEKVISNIELRGVKLDKVKLAEVKKRIEIELDIIIDEIKLCLPIDCFMFDEQDVYKFHTEYLNSPVKVLALIHLLGIDIDSTAIETLKKAKHEHIFIELLIEYRTYSKLLTTFVIPFLENKSNILHTSFNQTSTATGRLSSSNPNLQNIPSGDKSELGKKIRSCFIPHNMNSQILCADYSQFEIRILAHAANDTSLKSAFNSGLDIHTEVTKLIWDLPYYDAENPEHIKLRRYTKTLNFGLIYGMTSVRLERMTGLSSTKCEELITRHRLMLPETWQYLESQYLKAICQGYTETLLGRKRYFNFSHPYLQALRGCEIKDFSWLENKKVITPQDRAKLRQAANHPIQGSNADFMRLAMIELDSLGYEILLQIHDELVIEVYENKEQKTYQDVVGIMIGVTKQCLSVPVEVSAKIAFTWGEAK